MARSRWIWRILVAACAVCSSAVSGVKDPCEGYYTDRWSKLVAVQKVGPQVRLVVFDTRTGGSESFDVAEKISCDWTSSLAVDNTENKLYIQTANNLSALDLTSMTSTTVRLQGQRDISNELWNLAFWEGGGNLIGMLPDRNVTRILEIDPFQGSVQELHTVVGTPIKGLFCLDRFQGSYYFVVRNATTSLFYMVDLYHGAVDVWSQSDLKDLVSIHWDGKDALIGVYLNQNKKATLLRKIQFGSRLVVDIVDVQSIVSKDNFDLLDNQHFAESHLILPSPAGPWMISKNSISRSLGIFQICQREFFSLEAQSLIGIAAWYPALAEVSSREMYIMDNLSTTIFGLNFGLRSTAEHFQMDGIARPVVWISDSAIQLTVASSDFTGREAGILDIRDASINMSVMYRDFWKEMRPSEGFLVNDGVSTKISIYGLFNLSKRYFCQWNLTDFCHASEGCCYDVAQTRPLSIHEITCNVPSSFGQGVCEGVSCVRRIPFKLVDEFDMEIPCSAGSKCIEGFTIHPAAAVRLHLIQSTDISTAGRVLDRPFIVTVVDEYQNTVPSVQGRIRVRCFLQCSAGAEIRMMGNTSVQISQGTSVFSDFSIETAGNLMLVFEAEGLLPVRFNITVVPAQAHHLAVEVQPVQTTAGEPMLVQPTVHVLDSFDNVVKAGEFLVRAHLVQEPSTFDAPHNFSTCEDLQGVAQDSRCFRFCTGSIRIEDSVAGNHSIASVQGVVAFTDLSITVGTSRPIRLYFASEGLLGTRSDWLNISHSNLSHICICQGLQQSYVSMIDMYIPQVYRLDSWNNIVTDQLNSSSVQASLHENTTCQNFTSGGRLFGRTAAQAELGVAIFSDLHVNTISEWYFLLFQDEAQSSSITSDTFTVRVGDPFRLFITRQPSDGVAMQPLPRQPVVHILDAGNNTVPQQLLVNASLHPEGGQHLFGATSAFSHLGVVAFSDLFVSLAANFQLVFTSTCCLGATSDSFEIVFGPAWRLAVAVQPGNGSGGLPLDPQPVVDVLDLGGNRVWNSSAVVVALLTYNLTAEEEGGLAGNRSEACLDQLEWMVGNSSVESSGGQANFSNIAGMRAEKGYRIFFCSRGLWGAFSEPFDVVVGEVFALKIFVGASDVVAAERPARPARVCLVDRGENIVVESSIERVQVTLIPSQLSWTVNASSACISTAAITINRAGTYRLAFSIPADEQAKVRNSSLLIESDLFRVLVGEPFSLFLHDASNLTEIVAGHLYPRPLLVSVLDKGGNVVTNFSGPLEVLLKDGNETVANSSFSFSLTYVNGTFSVSHLTTCLIGSSFSLLFSSGPLLLYSPVFLSRSGEIADIRIVSQTTSAVAGQVFTPSNSIEIIDKCGNRAFGFADGQRALVLLLNRSSSVQLYGANSSFLHDGVVVFSELSMTRAGQPYFLQFVIPGLFDAPLSILSRPLVVHPNVARSIFASPAGQDVFKVDEPLDFLTVQVLDQFRNEVEEGSEYNVSVQLLAISSKTISRDCVGYRSCDVEIDVNEEKFLAFAFLSVSLTCTDFDHHTEFVRLYGLGGEPIVLDGESEMCMGSCLRTETVLHRLDVTQLARGGKLSLNLQATEEVNYYPCDGNFVIATFELLLLLGTEDATFGTQHLIVQNHRSLADVSIRASTGDYLLLFQDVDRNLSSHFVNFTLFPGTPVKLQSFLSPAGGRGGEVLEPQPIVHVEDAGGNLIEVKVNVSVSLLQAAPDVPSSSLRGNSLLSSQQGVASFTDLLVLHAPAVYKLLFSSDHLASVEGGTFPVVIGPPRLVSVLVQPSSITSGDSLAPVPVAQLADLGRNNVEQENVLITTDIAANGGVDGTLVGETTRGSDASGAAAFSSLSILKAGEGYALSFRFNSVLYAETSAFFNVSAGRAEKLRIRIQPAGGEQGALLLPQPSLEVTDANGNAVRDRVDRVDVQLLPVSGIFTRPDGDGRFEGSSFVQDEEGVVHFFNLTVKVAGAGFRFRFLADGLASVDSSEFSVRAAADLLVLSGRALVSGRTTETFGNSSIWELLQALSSVGQVDPASIAVLEVVDLQLRRRRLLVPSVEIKFEISTSSPIPSLALGAVNSFLQGHNSSFLLLQLDIFLKPTLLDSWQGLWVAEPNVSAGVREDASSSSVSLFLQPLRSYPPLSCQGRPQNDHELSMFCYDEDKNSFGAMSLTRSGRRMQGVLSSRHLLSQLFPGIQHINSFLLDAIDGPVRAVMLSSSFRDSPGNTPSPLLSVSLVDGQLQVAKLADLYTEGAVASKHLRIYGKDYLIFANHFDFYMQSYVTCSFIYTYEKYLNSWRRAGQVTTFGASAVEAFQLEGQSYLTITNFYNGSDYDLPTHLYRISFLNAQQVEDSNVHLTVVQTLQTNGARDVRKFERGQDHYLLFTSQMGDRVDLLRWDGDSFKPLPSLHVIQPTLVDVSSLSSSPSSDVLIAIASAAGGVSVYQLESDHTLVLLQNVSSDRVAAIRFIDLAISLPQLLAYKPSQRCLLSASSQFDGQLGVIRVLCDDLSNPGRFSLTHELPSSYASAISLLDFGSAYDSFLLSGSGWKGHHVLEYFQVDSLTMRREGNKISSPFLDSYDIFLQNHSYLVSSQLWDGNQFAKVSTTRSACILLNNSWGAPVVTNVSSIVDESGAVVAPNFSFPVTCQAITVQFSHPFLSSDPSRRLQVVPSPGTSASFSFCADLETSSLNASELLLQLSGQLDIASDSFSPLEAPSSSLSCFRAVLPSNDQLSAAIGFSQSPAFPQLGLTNFTYQPATPAHGSLLSLLGCTQLEGGRCHVVVNESFSAQVEMEDCFLQSLPFPRGPLELQVDSKPPGQFLRSSAAFTSPTRAAMSFSQLIVTRSGDFELDFSLPGFLSLSAPLSSALRTYWNGRLDDALRGSLLHSRGFSIATWGEDVLLLGGGGGGGESVQGSQLHLLNIADLSVQEGNTTGTLPPPLVEHAALVCHGSMWVVGGRDARTQEEQNALYQLDLQSMSWRRFTGQNCSPRGLASPHLTCTDKYLLTLVNLSNVGEGCGGGGGGGLDNDPLRLLRFSFLEQSWSLMTIDLNVSSSLPPPVLFGSANESFAFLVSADDKLYKVDLSTNATLYLSRLPAGSLLLSAYDWLAAERRRFLFALPSDTPSSPQAVRIVLLDLYDETRPLFIDLLSPTSSFPNITGARLTLLAPHRFLLKVDRSGQDTSTFVILSFSKGLQLLIRPRGLPATALIGDVLRLDPVSIADLQGSVNALDNSTEVRVSAWGWQGPSPLEGRTAVTAVGGQAFFTDLRIVARVDRSPISLIFSSPGLLPYLPPPLLLRPGSARRLRLTQEPLGIFVDEAFYQQPRVELLDEGDNVVEYDRYSLLEVQLKSANGSVLDDLSGTRTVQVVDGVASWSDLQIRSSSSSSFLSFYRAGVPRLLFQLNLTSYSSTTIRVENVTSKEIVSGRVFALLVERIVPQVSDRVVLSDSSTQVTVQLLGEEAATLGGQTTVTMSGGVAKFTDLVIDKTGQNFSLLVSASSVEGQTLSARSERFTVLPAQYFRLSIVVQAASAYGGEAFAVQPEIELLDLQNNRATLDDHTKVAVELAPGGGAGAICGRTIRTAVQGLVKFTDLAIDQLGSYSLRFSASSFNETSCFVSLLSSPDANCSCNCSVQGQAFSVEVGRPYRLLGLRDPSNGTGGTALPTQPQVGVVDRGGNLLQEVPSELKVFASLEIPRQDISDFLVLVSSIPTSSILGMLHLRVLQEDYVVFASFEVNGQTSINSTVLILNTQGQLIPQLNVLTTGASDWSAFKVEEEHFLVLSNLFDETSLLFDVPSHVYKFIPGDQPALLLLHHLPTVGAIGVEAFQIGRTPMAAIACQGDGTGPARSIIFSFNASGHAEVVQEVETHMAQGVAHLAIGCVDYLVFTNSFNFSSATGQGSALVLRWEEVAFAAHQLLPLDSPTAVSAYVASSRSLLLIGSRFGNSSLFVFDGEAFRLLPPLASALRMERLSSFEYGGTSMVGFASSALDSTGSATVGLITQPKLLEEGGNFVWETSASSSALPLASSVSDVLHVRTFAGPDLLLVSEKERTSVFALHPRKALAGQTFAVFVNGTGGGNAVATFEDLAVPEAGRWNFRFTAVNLEEGRTAPFLVRVGPRHSLSILVQPAQGRGGEVLLVQPRLRFLDAGGNWIGDAEGDVVNAVLQQEDSTLCLNSSNGSSAVTVGGVANFTDLVINRVGGDYTFLFSSSSFNVSSINVTVLPGTPTSFRWLRSPAENETVGQVLSSQPLLVAMDAACNDAAPHLLRIRISFSYDPSGMAGLMGSTTILREGPIVAFTDLSIDRTGSRFQLRLELERSNSAPSSSWNESGAVPIPARFAGGDVSSFFSVLPQPAGSLVSTRRVVARGAGTVWPNGTVTVSLGTSPRADYLAGFFVRLNSSSPSSSPHLFRIKSQTWDPESFSVSLLLFANPLDFQLEGQVDYEILAPAGDDMVLEVRGSRTHPSAHGVYDQLTEGDHPSFLQRTTTSLQLNASMLALPAEYDGVYAVLPERVNGKALYKQEEGNNFLFQNGTDSVLYWPAADSGQDRSEGWIFDEAAPASSWVVGDVATQSGERVEMSSLTAIERRHLIQFDQLNSSWVLRDGDRIVFRAASAEKSPGLFLKLWEELEPSSAGNSFVTSDLEIHFQPSASFSDDWGNVAEFQVFHDTELIPKSKSFAQSCFSNVLLQRLIYGSFTSKSFQVQGRDLLVLVRSTTAESCSGEGTCLPRFSMNSTMMMWVKRTGHTVAQIDNGDFDGELDTCPGGWTCQGNVNKSHDWNSPFLVHRVHGSFQPTHLFTYRSRLPPPGIALGPRTGSISQTILHGAHKGDVIRVNFSAAQDWFNGTMSAYLSRPVGQLTVLINDERVFGPITPSPIHYYELQNYSFLARVDRPFSVLTFLYTSYEQDFASDYPAARTIVTAVEITMHSSLLPFEAIELQGSMLHPEFHGEYKKTDVKYGGANVYWKQVPQDISMSSFLFFEHSRGTWMIISNFRLRRGAAPEFVAAGSSFLLTSDGGPEPLHRVAEFGPDYAGVLGAWREWNSSFNANDTTAEEVGLKALQDLFVCKYSNGDGCFYRDSLDMSVKELPSTLQTIFEIPTLAAVDCENFTVGNSNFLVFASFYNDSGIGSYFVDSHVYKYSIDGSFELHQNISTAGATDLEVFELAGQLWMVIAQYFDGLYYTSGSPLYRWVGEEDGKFELFKTFPTKAPRRWKHLLCEGTNFLIVVQGSVHNSTDIYVWKDDVANFELYYSVDQHGDDLAIFEDQCLFVIAGSCDGCTRVYQIHNGLVSMQQSLNIVRAVGLSTFRAASQLVIAVTVGSDAVEAGCGNSTGNSSSPAHVALFASACWDLGEACQSPMWRTIVTNSTITVPESSETAPGPARHLFMDSQHYIMVHSLTETQIWAVDGTGFRGGAESLTFWPEEGANAALVRFSGAAPWDRFDCNATRFYGFEMSSAMRSSYSPSTFAVQGKVP